MSKVYFALLAFLLPVGGIRIHTFGIGIHIESDLVVMIFCYIILMVGLWDIAYKSTYFQIGKFLAILCCAVRFLTWNASMSLNLKDVSQNILTLESVLVSLTNAVLYCGLQLCIFLGLREIEKEHQQALYAKSLMLLSILQLIFALVPMLVYNNKVGLTVFSVISITVTVIYAFQTARSWFYYNRRIP